MGTLIEGKSKLAYYMEDDKKLSQYVDLIRDMREKQKKLEEKIGQVSDKIISSVDSLLQEKNKKMGEYRKTVYINSIDEYKAMIVFKESYKFDESALNIMKKTLKDKFSKLFPTTVTFDFKNKNASEEVFNKLGKDAERLMKKTEKVAPVRDLQKLIDILSPNQQIKVNSFLIQNKPSITIQK